VSAEEAAAMPDIYREQRETYAMNMQQLQETAGLTYKEARAFLIYYRETVADMAEVLGISKTAVYNLQRKAKNKIALSGLTLEEIYGDYPPVDTGITFW
jgi:DNA-directed RNA polymerase specialized sigma subunit